MPDYSKELKIAELLVQEKLGKLSEEDRRFLEDWLAESQEHAVFYQKQFLHSDSNHPQMEFDLEKFTQSTLRKIQRRKARTFAIRLSSMAAILVIGVFSMLFFPKNTPTEKQTEVPFITERTQAVLSFPDGQQIKLTQAETQETDWVKYADRYQDTQTETVEPVKVKIEVARGGEYKIRLDDSTTVWLNSESTLIYPQKFNQGQRKVELTGEAYFEVKREDSRPFIVSAGDMEVKVLGTVFNIAAYPNEENITTTLVQGCVEVSTSQQSAKLLPGDQAIVQEGQEEIVIAQVDPTLYTSWTNGMFKFDNMSLSEICKRLSRWYHVDFTFEGDCANEKFTGGTWKYVPLEDFLTKIERVTDVVFQRDAKNIIVKRKK